MISKFGPRLIALAMGMMAALGVASAQFQGAIYTSLANGETVNQNLYAAKEDVYLNGGPQNQNGPGLPDGIYYFQVTDPSGATLLSSDNALDRRLEVIGGVVKGIGASGGTHQEGTLNPANGSIPVQLFPFDDTPNGGGEYKVWLIKAGSATIDGDDPRVLHFPNNAAKTDNFKVGTGGGGGDPVVFTLSGRKFYDANYNGLDDTPLGTLEYGVTGVIIRVKFFDGDGNLIEEETAVTGAGGFWSVTVEVPAGTFYEVCEDALGAGWLQTAPAPLSNGERCYSGLLTDQNVEGLVFGNIRTASVSGLKIYDSNVSGTYDDGDVPIEGFLISILATLPNGDVVGDSTYTAADGSFSFGPYPDGTTFELSETMPLGNWFQTFGPSAGTIGNGPVTEDVDVADLLSDITDQNFGNVALGGGGGHTLGFWSNKNGQATMNDDGSLLPELAELNAACLKDDAGNDVTFTSYTQFRNWLLNATATNMAYMLSAQYAAMLLNVEAGFVSESAMVYAPGVPGANALGFISIGDLLDKAEEALCNNAAREVQEAIKNALDNANNNTNFVLPPVPPVVYP